ncbi:hypothetical protein [Lactobacillus delbrueckii]|uniref:hypothetical protein n=1 Tax=Lactobacillus delbrueckii TaxID=1584 RepID=UPI003A8839A1
MLHKKFIVLIASILMTIGVVTIVSPVLAGNTSQTYWHNVYRILSPYDHTPARRKETKSAYYNKTNHIKISGNYIVIWAALYDGRDVSGGHRYKSYKGQVTNLWNNAVERYKKGVQVRIDSKRVANGWADGVWSPDTK